VSNFKTRLKELRKNEGYTQDELSKKLKISRSGLSAYEIGEREPDFTTLERIADFFNVDMGYLLGETEIKRKYTFVDDENFINENALNKIMMTENKTMIEILNKISNMTNEELEILNKLLK